jgi:hypothetical protein
MLKLVGVCSVCNKQFDTNNGGYQIQSSADESEQHFVLSKCKSRWEWSAEHVCGKECLYKWIDERIDETSGSGSVRSNKAGSYSCVSTR